MTWVKLCGMRSEADVAAAVAAGADAVGFVTAAGSPRRVTAAQAAQYGEASGIARFLVTRDERPETLLDQAQTARATGVQPHGAYALAGAEAALAAGLDVLFPVSSGSAAVLDSVPQGAIPIVDGPVPGSGERFDSSQVEGWHEPFVIAGGLTPANVGAVVKALVPYGVDVSSGIERERGVKDHELMREFVEAAR